MKTLVLDGDFRRTDLRTRMPFKYGIATMTSTPHAFVRVRAEIDGVVCSGVAADNLPPKWFTKDPARAVADEVGEMVRVVRHALGAASGMRGDSPFAAWRQLHEAQAAWGTAERLPPLLTQFGTSLVERALIEAACRRVALPFAEALRANVFGIELDSVHPPLKGASPADLLTPLRSDLIVRHTVGLADPLRDADVSPEERLDDGLPQSLEASIRAYALRQFKIKVSGELGRDLDRLRRVAEVVEGHARPDFNFSLDGNEQFRELESFRAFWGEVTGAMPRFFRHLRFVEQPFHRDVALSPDAVGGLARWEERPRLIIDESDGELDSLPRALALGYHGTSHKNCKGVFKSVANACLLNRMLREDGSRPYLLSGEDLANVGPVGLLQDLAACAALGVQGVERNGHHYFTGLSQFPESVQRQVLEAHGDLYHVGERGWPTLTIRDGMVSLSSVAAAPFGVGFEIDVGQFAPADGP